MNSWEASDFLSHRNDMPGLFGLREAGSGSGARSMPVTTLSSNDYYTWEFWKSGNIVTVFGSWVGNDGDWFSEVQATLPEGCRPPRAIYFPACENNHSSSYTGHSMVEVGADGKIRVQNLGGVQSQQNRIWSFSFVAL